MLLSKEQKLFVSFARMSEWGLFEKENNNVFFFYMVKL